MTERIKIAEYVGDFGEDKDAAAFLRNAELSSCLDKGGNITIDFEGVTLVTQSFIHALVSAILRKHGEDALDHLEFANCNESIRGIISTVVQYSLDSIDDDGGLV